MCQDFKFSETPSTNLFFDKFVRPAFFLATINSPLAFLFCDPSVPKSGYKISKFGFEVWFRSLVACVNVVNVGFGENDDISFPVPEVVENVCLMLCKGSSVVENDLLYVRKLELAIFSEWVDFNNSSICLGLWCCEVSQNVQTIIIGF